jgi:PelA/Pel-15E family pectate lyase
MIGILNVLKDASDGLPHWNWLDADRRERARRDVARGVECIVKCQIQTSNGRTGWCQQHDEETYAAASARTFELASCCPQDTTEIVRFLMRFDSSDEQVSKAIDDAVAWLGKTQQKGIRVHRIPAPIAAYSNHTEDFDTVVVADESAPPIWARHYEIGTDRPIFAGRDAVKRFRLAEIERERRTGTPWYGTWPQRLLETDYANWRRKRENTTGSPASR